MPIPFSAVKGALDLDHDQSNRKGEKDEATVIGHLLLGSGRDKEADQPHDRGQAPQYPIGESVRDCSVNQSVPECMAAGSERRATLFGAAFSATGSSSSNTVPSAVDRTSRMSPPWARISSRAMARPSPVPPDRAEPAKGWNRRSTACGGRPRPLSRISIRTRLLT